MAYSPNGYPLTERSKQAIPPHYKTVPVIGKKRASPDDAEQHQRPRPVAAVSASSTALDSLSSLHHHGKTSTFTPPFTRNPPPQSLAKHLVPTASLVPKQAIQLSNSIPYQPATFSQPPTPRSQASTMSANSKFSVVIPPVTPPSNARQFTLADTDEIQFVAKRTQIARDLVLVNSVDNATLPKNFTFVDDYVFVGGTKRLEPEFRTGCSCPPNNGRNIGCEYVHKCECLEDSARTSDGRRVGYPYVAEGENKGCLRDKFLKERHVIYECSPLCGCGPTCRNMLVQHGRKIKLEIFRTSNGRGWGLRSPQYVKKGTFIDTYRGEVITNAEADRREETSTSKDSYLFTLDKFASDELTEDDLYVVDGEFKGGPTRFINHSCDPNCSIWCVSTTRGDAKVYELAFFAIEDIPPYTEMTFDYLGEEPSEETSTNSLAKKKEMEAEKGKLATRCLCGSEYCRGFLWL